MVDRLVIFSHQILRCDPFEHGFDHDPPIAPDCGAVQKPADEDQPKTGKISSENLDAAQNHQKKGQSLSSPGGDTGGPSQVAGDFPDDGSQDSASIHRKPGEKVEYSEDDVDETEVGSSRV